MTATGNTLTLNLAISFSAGYAGAKNVFGFAQDLGSLLSGWQTFGTWTVTGAAQTPAAPQAGSVLPASGSGATQAFTFTFSDANGHADIHSARILIHSQIQGANSCYLYYTKADNKLYLHNDAANALTAPLTPGAAGSIGNSQCSVDGAASSMTATGNTLTLNLAISFSAGYAGAKNVFGFSQDFGSLLSGWQTFGTWTVTGAAQTPAAPQAVSVLPASGSGTSHDFTFLFSDLNGHADIHSARILIHQQIQGSNSCYLYYTKADNKLYLHNDAGTSLGAPITPGNPGSLGNSQCAVLGLASFASASGNTLTLRISGSFFAGFPGTKNVFGYVTDAGGLASGWQNLGTWTVPGGVSPPAGPHPVSVNPASGSGAEQIFTVTFSHPVSYNNIRSARVLIHEQIQGENSCYIYYTRAGFNVYLHNDEGNSLGTPMPFDGILQNSQCWVNDQGSRISHDNTRLTLFLAITFKPGFTGPKNIFANVEDVNGAVSGWQNLGTWTALAGSAPVKPQVESVAPLSGSGATQVFSFTFSDPNGSENLETMNGLIGNVDLGDQCVWAYVLASNEIILDMRGVASTRLTPGAPGIVNSPACSLNAELSSITRSGNLLTVNAAIAFASLYAGAKTIYGRAADRAGLESGWRAIGSWTVPGIAVPPQAISVTPSSGSGLSQVFSVTYSDANGHEDMWDMRLNIGAENTDAASCHVRVTVTGNRVYLFNNQGTLLLDPAEFGQGVIQNSQCLVNAGGSSIVASGNTLTLNLAITFKEGYQGDKKIFASAIDRQGLTSWAMLGNWIVPGS
jgi:hypothetical protein